MKFKSSLFWLLYNYIWTLLGCIGIIVLVGYLLNKFVVYIKFGYVLWLLLGAAGICFIYSVITGIVTAETDEKGITVKALFTNTKFFPYEDYSFSSRIKTHSVNFIPVQTERFIVVTNDKEEYDVRLPNFSKKAFDKLMSQLNKNSIINSSKKVEAEFSEEGFSIPKDEILSAQMNLLKVYSIIAFIICIILSVILSIMMRRVASGGELIFFITQIVLFTAAFFIIPGVCIYVEYLKKDKITPERVYIKRDNIIIDNDKYHMENIKKITATPPDYEDGVIGGNSRKIIIYSKGKKRDLYLGVRMETGINKVLFKEYDKLCWLLEKTAVLNGVDFIYDL